MPYRNLVIGTQLTGVTGVEQFFAETFSLQPGETAHVQVKANSSGTTDNIIFNIYSSPKANPVAADYDTVAYATLAITATSGGDVSQSVIIDQVRSFRVGAIRSGSTDNFACDLQVSLDGKDLY